VIDWSDDASHSDHCLLYILLMMHLEMKLQLFWVQADEQVHQFIALDKGQPVTSQH
jgi:hypothetical protein